MTPLTASRREPRRHDLMIRMFLVILPGQLLGYVLGALIAGSTGVFRLPYGGLIVNAAAAVTAGLTVGLATTPLPRHRPLGAALSAVLGAAVALAVITIATARLATGHLPTPLDVTPGVIITALGQGVITWVTWTFKPAPSTPSCQN